MSLKRIYCEECIGQGLNQTYFPQTMIFFKLIAVRTSIQVSMIKYLFFWSSLISTANHSVLCIGTLVGQICQTLLLVSFPSDTHFLGKTRHLSYMHQCPNLQSSNCLTTFFEAIFDHVFLQSSIKQSIPKRKAFVFSKPCLCYNYRWTIFGNLPIKNFIPPEGSPLQKWSFYFWIRLLIWQTPKPVYKIEFLGFNNSFFAKIIGKNASIKAGIIRFLIIEAYF